METQKDVRDVKEGDREVKEFKKMNGGWERERERQGALVAHAERDGC